MKKVALALMASFWLVGCGDSDVDLVKNGVLLFDKTLSIGQAIDNYKYCDKKPKWQSFKTDNGREIVQASCSYDINGYKKLNANIISKNINSAKNSIQNYKNEIEKYNKEIKEANAKIKENEEKIKKAEPIINKIEELEKAKFENMVTKKFQENIDEIDRNLKALEKEGNNVLNTNKRYSDLHYVVENWLVSEINNSKRYIRENTTKIQDLEPKIAQNEEELKYLLEQEKQLDKLKRELIIQFVLTKDGGFEVFAVGINANTYENPDEIHTADSPEPLDTLAQIYNNQAIN